MALRLDAAGDYLGRTANLPSTTAFTLCGWFKKRGAGGSVASTLCQITTLDYASYIIAYSGDGANNRFVIESDGVSPVTGSAITIDAWYFVALSGAGTGATDAKVRYAAVGATSFTTTQTRGRSFTAGQVTIGEADSQFYGDQSLAGWKLYDRVLTDAELLSEMHRLTPASTTNLNLWTPMVHNSVANAVKDFSGNGRDWTANGSLTIEDGPPIGWGGSIIVPQYAAAGGGTVTVVGQTLTATASLVAGAVTGAASVSGQTLTATASLVAGAVTGAASVSGQTLTASASLLAGGASTAGSVSVAGQTLTTTASLIAGAVTGAAAVAGQTLTASASLVVGAATGAASVAGQVLTATGSLIAGAVTGAASVSGQVLTATTSLIAGAVSGGTVTVAGQILTVTATLISGMGGAVAGLWGRLWRGSLWSGGVFRG